MPTDDIAAADAGGSRLSVPPNPPVTAVGPPIVMSTDTVLRLLYAEPAVRAPPSPTQAIRGSVVNQKTGELFFCVDLSGEPPPPSAPSRKRRRPDPPARMQDAVDERTHLVPLDVMRRHMPSVLVSHLLQVAVYQPLSASITAPSHR